MDICSNYLHWRTCFVGLNLLVSVIKHQLGLILNNVEIKTSSFIVKTWWKLTKLFKATYCQVFSNFLLSKSYENTIGSESCIVMRLHKIYQNTVFVSPVYFSDDSVLIWKNKSQRKPLFCYILRSVNS